MEWSRVKSILICVFLVVNSFLLTTYLHEGDTGIVITEEMTAHMTTVLEKNGVTMDVSLLPKKVESVRLFDGQNQYATPLEMAQHAFGQAPLAEATQTTFVCTQLPGQKAVKRLTERNAKKTALQTLAGWGLLGEMDVEVSARQTDNGYGLLFSPVYEGRRLLDVHLYAEVTQQGVSLVKGDNWLMERMSNSGVTAIQSPVDILVEFAIARPQGSPPCEIIHLELGYFVGNRNGQQITVTAVPAWQIVTSDGKFYYYDARNGDLLS